MSASHNLNADQLGGLAKKLADPEQRGFSARAFGADAGASPEHKLMVGIPGHGDEHLSMPVSGERIGEYADKQAEALRPSTRYLGGWNPEERSPASADLDVAQSFGHAELDKAMALAHQGHQEAIGAVGKAGAYLGELPVVSPRTLLRWAAGDVMPRTAGGPS